MIQTRRDQLSSRRAGMLVGAAVAAAADQIIFHQLLAWHHWYDSAGPAVGLIYDGVMHAVEIIALMSGFFWLMRLKSRDGFYGAMIRAGLVLGAGAYLLTDGIIAHKVLALHQVRYGVNLLIYDMTWNLVAIALLLWGFALVRRARLFYQHSLSSTLANY